MMNDIINYIKEQILSGDKDNINIKFKFGTKKFLEFKRSVQKSGYIIVTMQNIRYFITVRSKDIVVIKE